MSQDSPHQVRNVNMFGDSCTKQVDESCSSVFQSLRKKVLEVQEKISSGVGLVIEGGALAILLNPSLQETFLEMCKTCKAVVCCRVSPIQKAQVKQL